MPPMMPYIQAETHEASFDQETLLDTDFENEVPSGSSSVPSKGRSYARLVLACMMIAAVCVVVIVVPGEGDAGWISKKHGKLAHLVQLHALNVHGKFLSNSDIEGALKLARSKKGQAGRIARKLADVEEDPLDKDELVEAGLSKPCASAIEAKLTEILMKFSELLADTMISCLTAGLFGGPCDEDSDKSMDKFIGDLGRDCQTTGDACNVTFTDDEGGELQRESQMFCVPKECHDEASKLVDVLQGDVLGGQKAEHSAVAKASEDAHLAPPDDISITCAQVS